MDVAFWILIISILPAFYFTDNKNLIYQTILIYLIVLFFCIQLCKIYGPTYERCLSIDAYDYQSKVFNINSKKEIYGFAKVCF
jgi:hypothetical protein